MTSSYRFIVAGRVQGVFFRQATFEKAQALGLVGWVSNLADGRVEGVACGEREALDVLHQWLQHGPPSARVESVIWREATEAEAREEFVVLR